MIDSKSTTISLTAFRSFDIIENTFANGIIPTHVTFDLELYKIIPEICISDTFTFYASRLIYK